MITYCVLWEKKPYSLTLFKNLGICRDLKIYFSYHIWLQNPNLQDFYIKWKNISFSADQSQLFFSFVEGTCKAFASYKVPRDRQFLGILIYYLRCEVSTDLTRPRGSISVFKAYYVLLQEKSYVEGYKELPPNIRSSQTVASC